jgi:hypothetical protein
MKGERRPQALKGQGRKALEGTWRQRPSLKRASPRHFSSAEAKAIDLLEGLYPLGTLKGLTTYYVLFFIHQESRQVRLAGFTPYPDQEWMEQQARNMTMEEWGSLRGCRYLLHDRDAKFCESVSETDQDGKSESASIASKEPESELVCGTLGEIGQRRMSVEVDPVWRIFAAASIAAISRTLPWGAQPSGQRQSDFVSFAGGERPAVKSRRPTHPGCPRQHFLRLCRWEL